MLLSLGIGLISKCQNYANHRFQDSLVHLPIPVYPANLVRQPNRGIQRFQEDPEVLGRKGGKITEEIYS